MAQQLSIGVKCNKCASEILEYLELKCKHILCTYCAKQATTGRKVKCPLAKCKKQPSQQVPNKKKVKRIQSISEAVQSMINTYESLIDKQEKECIKHIKALEASVKSLKHEEERQMTDITNTFNLRVKQLEKHYGGMKEQTSESYRKRECQLGKMLDNVQNILEQIRDEIRNVYDAISGNPNDKTEDIERKLKEDIKRKTAECASQTIEMDIPPMEVKINVSDELDLHDSVDISAEEPVLRTNFGQRPDMANNESSGDLEWLSSKEWVRQEQSVKLPIVPNRLCLMLNNELWLCHNGGITVLDAELRPLREIESDSDSGDMGDVEDVAALSDGDVAVAGDEGLFQIDLEGKKRHCIDEGEFTGVVEYDGALYVVDNDIRVYEQAGGWKQCRRIDLRCGSQYLTISIQDNMIYACLCDDAKLLAYTLSGEPMGSWGNKGYGEAGELSDPFLCMTAIGGAVLIADRSNNRLQVLGADRQWRIVSLQPPLKWPISATLHCGRLLVASSIDNTLYVYDPK